MKTIADHGDTTSSATPIVMDDPADSYIHRMGRVIADFHSAADVDVFRLDLTERKEVFVRVATIGVVGIIPAQFSSYSLVTLEVLDSDGTPLRRPLLGYNLNNAQYTLEAGTYYLRFSPYMDTPIEENDLVPYGFRVKENVEYLEFLNRCGHRLRL